MAQLIELQRSLIGMIERSLTRLRSHVEEEGMREAAVHRECGWLIRIILLFPEADDYRGFLEGLQALAAHDSAKETAVLLVHTLDRFVDMWMSRLVDH
jgi:hypothetical protein